MRMSSPQSRWTAAMVRTLPEDGLRHEVVDGVHLVTPAPSWTHQAAVLQLARRLLDYAARHAVGHVVVAPADVELDEHNLVQPDVFVVPLTGGRRPRSWSEAGRLLLAVEVVSASTIGTDRLRKRRLYQRRGVPDYWIIDVDAPAVERWRSMDTAGTVLTTTIDWHPSPDIDALVIDLDEYFRDVTGEG